jgi:hypothetical protein
MLASAAKHIEDEDGALTERLKRAERGTFYHSLGLSNSTHIDESKKQEHRQKAQELLVDTGIEVDPEKNEATIPWAMAPKLGKLCIFVLSNPQRFRPYVDGSCGGYTIPWAVKEVYENIGRLNGAIAVQENFTSYQYSNPYEWE